MKATSALKKQLTAWRKKPTSELAASIEALGADLARTVAPSDWDLSRFDAGSLSSVLGWFEQAPDDQLLPVLRHLASLLPDPRATRPLLALLSRSFARPIERATVFARLVQNADPREAALARELGVTSALALANDESADLLRFANERDDMLSAMFARPDDVLHRQVTADWLMSFGDPFGELIALQLARGDGPPSAPELDLLKRHSNAFLFDFFAPEPVREVAFHLGVPLAIEVGRPVQWKPAFSTVRRVRRAAGTSWDWLLKPEWIRVESTTPAPELDPATMNRTQRAVRFKELMFTKTGAELVCFRHGTLEVYVGKARFSWAPIAKVREVLPVEAVKVWVSDELTVTPPPPFADAEVYRVPPTELARLVYERRYRQ